MEKNKINIKQIKSHYLQKELYNMAKGDLIQVHEIGHHSQLI